MEVGRLPYPFAVMHGDLAWQLDGRGSWLVAILIILN